MTSPSIALLITLIFIFVILIICFITGLVIYSLSSSCSSCGRRSNKLSAFSAAPTNPGSGTVELSWQFDLSGLGETPSTAAAESVDFNLRIWYNAQATGTQDELLLLTSDDSGDVQYHTPTTSGNSIYNYTAVLDASKYFSVGTNSVTIQSVMGSGNNTIQSDQTSPAVTVTVSAAISSQAVWSSSKFVACGYNDPENFEVAVTPVVLLWKQPLDNVGLVPSEYCYKITFSEITGDLTGFGFPTNPYTVNGISVTRDPNDPDRSLIVTATDNATITKLSNDCCCIPENQNTSIIQFGGDTSNYYLLLRSPTPVNQLTAGSVKAHLSLYTYQSDCVTAIPGGRSQADLFIAGPSDVPTLTQTPCSPNCSFDESIAPNKTSTTGDTTCNTTLSPQPASDFTGGSAVTLTITNTSWLSSTGFKAILYVTESVINSGNSQQYAVVVNNSDNWPITWNLPSGYYTTSCVLYANVFINGPIIPVYSMSQNVVNGVFQVDLDTPQNVGADASLSS